MTSSAPVTVAGVPVYFGRSDQHLRDWHLRTRASSVHVICDTNTAEHCLPLLPALHDIAHTPIVIAAGEIHKTLDTCTMVWRTLIAQGARRDSAVINLGGGVVTDLGGFCAATYQRGISFIHIPTTLLGMCDAALGGKHGVDLDALKNYIGVFAQPQEIWIDPQYLHTLPERHVQNGLAEVIKHAIIGDPALFDILEQHTEIDRTEMIRNAVGVKKHFVDTDMYERSGQRAALNFGHTIGHAVESISLRDQNPILHGECVAIGMIIETWIAGRMAGGPTAEICHRICRLIRRLIPLPGFRMISLDDLMAYLVYDKKRTAGSTISMSLIRGIGEPLTGVEVSERMVHDALESVEVKAYLP